MAAQAQNELFAGQEGLVFGFVPEPMTPGHKQPLSAQKNAGRRPYGFISSTNLYSTNAATSTGPTTSRGW